MNFIKLVIDFKQLTNNVMYLIIYFKIITKINLINHIRFFYFQVIYRDHHVIVIFLYFIEYHI